MILREALEVAERHGYAVRIPALVPRAFISTTQFLGQHPEWNALPASVDLKKNVLTVWLPGTGASIWGLVRISRRR